MVARERRAEQLVEQVEFGVPPAAVEVAHPEATGAQHPLTAGDDPLHHGPVVVRAPAEGVGAVGLGVPGALDESGVVRRIVRLERGRHRVEAVHQEPELLGAAVGVGSGDLRQPAFARPVLGGLQQRGGDLLVVGALEPAEEADVAVALDVPRVPGGGDPAEYPAAVHRQEVLGLRFSVVRVVPGGHEAAGREGQGRHPARVVPVEGAGHGEELADHAAPADRLNCEHVFPPVTGWPGPDAGPGRDCRPASTGARRGRSGAGRW